MKTILEPDSVLSRFAFDRLYIYFIKFCLAD